MSNKFLDKTGLTHFWGKIKTLLAGKADRNHTHTDSVKIETPNGDVAEIVAYTNSETGYPSIETGYFHSTASISSEGDISADGRIISRSFDFDMAGDRCISVNHSNEAIEVCTDGYALTVDSGTLLLEGNGGCVSMSSGVDEEENSSLFIDSNTTIDGNITTTCDVNANIARVDEVDFKMCDNDGNEAPSVLMYGYYDENDERHLMVEVDNLEVTGSIKAEQKITISTPNGDNVYLIAYSGGEEYPPSIETGRFHSTTDISSEGKVIADGKIYEEGTPLSDKYASKTDLEDVRDALVTCDATVGGLVDSVSDLEDNTEKMTNHYIGHPEGGEYQYLGAITGAIFIKVPVITNGGKVSFDVNISCNRYQSDAIYRVCGYMPGSGNWGNTGAFCMTSLQNHKDGIANASSLLWNLVVGFGYQNGEYGVYIGNLQTVFHEPVITISNVSVYAWAVRDTANLRKNWEVSIVSSYPIPINSIVPNAALYTPKRTDYTLDEIGMPKSSINAPFTVQPFMSSTRAMRLFGLPADQVIIEQSIDGGATWTSANVTDWTKAQIFSQTKLGSIKIPLKNGSKSCDCMLRVTITGMKYNVPE